MSGLRTISLAILGTLVAAAFIVADPNSGESPATGQPLPQEEKQYVYTLNGLGYDCFKSAYADSMPILNAYIKWIAGDNLTSRTAFVMDGQYAYHHIFGEQHITRFNLRTGEISRIVNLEAALKSNYNDIWMEGDMLFLGGGFTNAQGKGQGIAYGISIKEQKVKWSFSPPQNYGLRLMLVVPGDKVIVSVVDKLIGNVLGGCTLYCLKGTNGEVLWKQADSSDGVVLCSDALICAAQKEMCARSLKDGSEIWRTPYKGFSYANQGIFSDNKRVFIPDTGRDYSLIAFDGTTGKEIWRRNGVVGHSLDGKGHIIVAEYDQKLKGAALLLDPATGETAAKLPVNLMAAQALGDWAYASDFGFTKGPPAQILGVILSFNTGTGKSNILLDGRVKDAPINPGPVGYQFPAIDGYLLTNPALRSGKRGWVCLEDMRFHPDAAKIVLGIKAGEFDEKTMARVADLIGKLGSENPDVKKAATEELQPLLDIAEEHLESAAKDNSKPNVKEAAEKILKRLNDLRKYLDELGCRKDPIYFTALIRHTADLAIQQKAIDRLKKITAQDFGLKPSAEWIKDQKEASDKYDDWWLKNRDKLAWSDKEDRYIPR